jgi:hypothetical protein
MKQSKLLTNITVIAILLTIGFSCKSINIPSIGGGGVSESSNPQEAVLSANKKLMEQKSYHSVVKTKNSMATTEMEEDFLAPDRFSIKNNVANYKTEMILIGNESFIRSNGGKWTRDPGNQLSVNEIRGKMTEEAVKAMKDFELVGKETLDGKDTVVFKFKSTYMGDSTSKMWVATDTGLPLKVDSEGTYGGTKVETSITYDYSKEVKIEAPQVN